MRIKHRLNGNEEDDFGLVNVEELNNQIDEFTGSDRHGRHSYNVNNAHCWRYRGDEHHARERHRKNF